MKITTSTIINSPKAEVWKVITDIKNSDKFISGISKVEVLQDSKTLRGFRWRETRTMFGKEATEEMEITNYQKEEFYDVAAASHGAEYLSRVSINELSKDSTELSYEFSAKPVTLSAKMFSFMGYIFKNATKKALHQDLLDIKKHIESKNLN